MAAARRRRRRRNRSSASSTETARIRAIAEAAAPLGCTVGLYNHEGWFGEPENQLAILDRLARAGVRNVGLVYNFHHGHSHLDRFPELFEKMKPHLLALNLNGMFRDGNRIGRQIVPVGQGDLDLQLLRIVRDSGWRGPIGLLNHTDEDAEARLLDNLDGLAWLDALLHGEHPPQPTPRSWKAPAWPPTPGDVSAGDEIIIPAATDDELTRANGWPADAEFRKWDRSLGGGTSNRFSALTQIDKSNVGQLEVAWTYHSGDGTANLQCNPIVVDGVMYAPTGGWNIVALDATNGKELWRFQLGHLGQRLEDQPARRGLLYWKGDAHYPARIIFGAGNWIYALDPKTGASDRCLWQGGPHAHRHCHLRSRRHLPGCPRGAGLSWRHFRLPRGHGRAALDLPHQAARRRIRPRHLEPSRRRRELLGRHGAR